MTPFDPVRVGRVELRNRVVMAPMASGRANPDGSISQRLLDHYRERAEGGLLGSYRQTMTVAGIASGPSQWSMQEISRFFERDARRYG